MGDIKETNMEENHDTLFCDEDRNTPLHYASARGNLKEANECVESYKKLDLENCLGWTPLMMAARNGHLEIVKLLITAKANATKCNQFGASVFMMACANGGLEIINFILQHLLTGGVSRKIIESSVSPLSMAILFTHDHILQELIAKGFNVNAEAIFTKVTPLMFAAAMKNTSAFNILISHGANLFAENINKQSARDITLNQTGIEDTNLQPQMPQQRHSICIPSPQVIPQAVYNMHSPVTFAVPYPVCLPARCVYQGTGSNVSRRSSNLESPLESPIISPITTGQMFFPPNFNSDVFLPAMTMGDPTYNYSFMLNADGSLNTTYTMGHYPLNTTYIIAPDH